MIQLSELIGHRALDASTATSTGTVTGIGLTANRIATVGVDGAIVDAATAQGFDGDVVIYHSRSQARSSAQPPPFDPRGTKVLDRHGDLLGTIADLIITDEGLVDTIMLNDGHSLHGTRLQAIGSYAAVVTNATGG